MLVVFDRAPAAPFEAVSSEEAIGLVGAGNLVAESGLPVGIAHGCRRLDGDGPTTAAADAGIVERIDVNRHAAGVGRQLSSAFYGTKAEADWCCWHALTAHRLRCSHQSAGCFR